MQSIRTSTPIKYKEKKSRIVETKVLSNSDNESPLEGRKSHSPAGLLSLTSDSLSSARTKPWRQRRKFHSPSKILNPTSKIILLSKKSSVSKSKEDECSEDDLFSSPVPSFSRAIRRTKRKVLYASKSKAEITDLSDSFSSTIDPNEFKQKKRRSPAGLLSLTSDTVSSERTSPLYKNKNLDFPIRIKQNIVPCKWKKIVSTQRSASLPEILHLSPKSVQFEKTPIASDQKLVLSPSCAISFAEKKKIYSPIESQKSSSLSSFSSLNLTEKKKLYSPVGSQNLSPSLSLKNLSKKRKSYSSTDNENSSYSLSPKILIKKKKSYSAKSQNSSSSLSSSLCLQTPTQKKSPNSSVNILTLSSCCVYNSPEIIRELPKSECNEVVYRRKSFVQNQFFRISKELKRQTNSEEVMSDDDLEIKVSPKRRKIEENVREEMLDLESSFEVVFDVSLVKQTYLKSGIVMTPCHQEFDYAHEAICSAKFDKLLQQIEVEKKKERSKEKTIAKPRIVKVETLSQRIKLKQKN